MWCPSVSLSVWANAWLAGRAAPDDVLDALSAWAPAQSVIAYDAVAAGRTGLPWPDVNEAGPVSLLQTLRSAVRTSTSARPAIRILQPVPGDVRGLPPRTQFAEDALAAGEAVVVGGPEGAIGVVPALSPDDDATDDDVTDDGASDGGDRGPGVLSWSVYSLPDTPGETGFDLGEAEYALRSAVRTAAEALSGLRLVGGGDDPRALVEEVLEAAGHHRIPDHAPPRAVRVLATAAHVDAILTVSTGMPPIGIQSASEVRIADDALRPLAAVVRRARGAAVAAILHSAWEDRP